MNFFGHAAIACDAAGDARAVLGSMLPDFATMCRGRLAEPDDPELARGIELHHATDAAFHRLPAALELMRALDDRLARAGCARGPRRAASHVGVELLLDGVLVIERGYRESYLAALACDAAAVRWRDAGDGDRFAILLARLRSHGVPDDLRRPEAITQRLHRMLAHRPLLAPSSSDLEAIHVGLVNLQPRVTLATPAIMAALKS